MRPERFPAPVENESVYRTLVDTSPDAIVLTDLDLTILMANQQTVDLFGGEDDSELIGKNAFNFVHAADHPRARSYAAKVLDSGMLRDAEITLLRKDGSRFSAEIDASLVPSATGTPSAFLMILRDISERKRVLNALTESESRYRNLIETCPDAVLLMNLQGSIVFCNKRAAELFGSTSQQKLLRRNLHDLVSESDRESVSTMMTRIVTQGALPHLEYSITRGDGTLIRVDASISLVRDHSEKPVAITSFLRDVTDRDLAQAKIREQAALLNVDPAAILVRDLDDLITFWNKGAERLYGWTTEEILGRPITELIPKDQLAPFLQAKRILLDKGEWKGERVKLKKDGTQVVVDAQWNLVRDEQGRPKAVYVVDVDITEKKKLEDQVVRAGRLESVGTLAGGIAHDLNNVLSPIILSLQVLRKGAQTEKERKLLALIEASAQRGAQMIRQVLTFARGVEGERIAVNVGHLVREFQEHSTQTLPRMIELRTEIEKNLWTIDGDPTQIHQVLLNLCVNARDAMPHGGALSIEVRNVLLDKGYAQMHPNATPGKYVSLAVSDTGTGMSKEVVERVFEPFFTTKEAGKGTGLGLSTTLGIVKSHGGIMNVYSELGKGSKFLVYLPVGSETREDRARQEEEELPLGKGELILVADDEATILEITRATLDAHGYRVITAKDGTEAIAEAASHKGDLGIVVCDMNMPFMDGPATIRALHRMNPSLKFILVSGLRSNTQTREFENLTYVSTLQKPYTADRLLKTLRELCDSA